MKDQSTIDAVAAKLQPPETLSRAGDEPESTSDQQPPAETDPRDKFRFGDIEIIGDITAPLYTDEEWEECFEAEAAKYK